MKLKIYGEETDVNLEGVSKFLYACGCKIRGDAVPDFIVRDSDIGAGELFLVAMMLCTEEAELLIRATAKGLENLAKENGVVVTAKDRIRNDLKHSENREANDEEGKI